ncbi:hypothetical protein SB659_10345 [Arthrobacter sp. SIMBA_036]|uniref:hypothetical protein n=1 Tax=Arthrobacter sp. SIMBA_036 TaxID=3085778 RepID=UPI003979C562
MEKLKSWFVDDEGANPGHICAAVGGAGVVLIVLGLVTVWGTGWGKDLFAPGATLVTVALTGWATSRAVLKWTEQREQDRQKSEYAQREKVYEELIIFMLSCITDIGIQYDVQRDGQLRAKATLWGSAATIVALGNFQQLLGRMIKLRGGLGKFQATKEETRQLEDKFARALESMRKDLASSDKNSITRTEILASIFN